MTARTDEDWNDWGGPERPSPGRGAAGPAPARVYTGAADWVRCWLAPTVRRHVNEKRAGEVLAWCPHWAAHPEAADRIDAMWRAWEASRASTDPAAVADWWLSIADPMLTALMDPSRGPFTDCHRNGHADTLPALPLDDPGSAPPTPVAAGTSTTPTGSSRGA